MDSPIDISSDESQPSSPAGGSRHVEKFPDEMKIVLEALKYIDMQQNKLRNRYEQEQLELEKKYANLKKPLYERRHALITGSEPTTEEISEGKALLQMEFPYFIPPPTDTISKGIPKFWLVALLHSKDLASMISERDAKALQHLIDIRCSYHTPDSDPDPGFQLSFHFRSNEFFQNTVLTKDYFFKRGTIYADSFIYYHAIGMDIGWRSDAMDLTKDPETGIPAKSFFNFFKPPVLFDPFDPAAGEISDEDFKALADKVDDDLEAGEVIKDDIIQNAFELCLYSPDDDDESMDAD